MSNSTQTKKESNFILVEFPTITLFRNRIRQFEAESGKSLRQIAIDAGLSYSALVDICCREPGTIKDQKSENMIQLADRLNAVGVNISRQDIANVFLHYPSFYVAS